MRHEKAGNRLEAWSYVTTQLLQLSVLLLRNLQVTILSTPSLHEIWQEGSSKTRTSAMHVFDQQFPNYVLLYVPHLTSTSRLAQNPSNPRVQNPSQPLIDKAFLLTDRQWRHNVSVSEWIKWTAWTMRQQGTWNWSERMLSLKYKREFWWSNNAWTRDTSALVHD